MGASISLKAATKSSLQGKKNSESLGFQATFLKQKQRCAIKKWSDYNKFGVNISCSVTFFPKVGARILLKVAIKASFGDKEKLRQSRFLG